MNSKQQHLTTQRFSDFELPTPLQKAIAEVGYTYCTPIQANTLPVILNKQNIIGQADTGTGKTATFLIATICSLLNNSNSKQPANPRALILAPTRELALQIHNEARALLKHTDLQTTVIYGGANYEKQKKQLKQCGEILIATVGRVIDFYKQKLVSFDAVETVVLDEADRMIDMGFIKDVRYILKKLPPANKRFNLLFSATINFKVKEFAYELMDDPQTISVESEKADSPIEQLGYYVSNSEKIPVLIGLLKQFGAARTIVFANTKSAAEEINAYLNGNDLNAELLSGDVPQNRRQRLVKEFGEGVFDVLVATDVAARGLHIDGVTHVINFDLPQDPEDYIHRIGRTGRIGSKGNAINLICESYAFYLPDIEMFIGNKIATEAVTQELLAEVLPAKKIARRKPKLHNRKKVSPHHKKTKQPRKNKNTAKRNTSSPS